MPTQIPAIEPTIQVGETIDPNSLLASIDEARREEIIRGEKRIQMAKKIAEYRWAIATSIHRLQDCKTPFDFKSHAFQKAILQDDAIDRIVYGSAQWGKTECMICEAVACAGVAGLKVMWIISKKDKLNQFVSTCINPRFSEVPAYKKLVEQARARGGTADNTTSKEVGAGIISFVFATANRNFTSLSCDCALADEYQDCKDENLRRIPDRLSGSPFGFVMRVGHPTTPGTEENENLDYFYQNSDKRIWEVPCPWCFQKQELTWFGHCVHETKNRNGGITSIKPRDEQWRANTGLDMRPVCMHCHRPMNRFASGADWRIQNPGHPRHGFQLSNLYNPSPMNSLRNLYARYLSARYNPSLLADFFSKVLGKPFDISCDRISAEMLANCSTGEESGVAPYKFLPATKLDWSDMMKREKEMAA